MIVLHELYYGAFESARLVDNLKTVASLGLEFLNPEHDDARTAAVIRHAVAMKGTPLGSCDVLIAGQALARDLTLISRNVREFSGVDGLRVENWQA
jgi:tRNA(fMet)-specific endonuclease VapC